MVSDPKITTTSAEGQAESLAEADDLIREMVSYLQTDITLGEALLACDLAWMRRAKAYLESRRHARRLVVESPEAT